MIIHQASTLFLLPLYNLGNPWRIPGFVDFHIGMHESVRPHVGPHITTDVCTLVLDRGWAAELPVYLKAHRHFLAEIPSMTGKYYVLYRLAPEWSKDIEKLLEGDFDGTSMEYKTLFFNMYGHLLG